MIIFCDFCENRLDHLTRRTTQRIEIDYYPLGPLYYFKKVLKVSYFYYFMSFPIVILRITIVKVQIVIPSKHLREHLVILGSSSYLSLQVINNGLDHFPERSSKYLRRQACDVGRNTYSGKKLATFICEIIAIVFQNIICSHAKLWTNVFQKIVEHFWRDLRLSNIFVLYSE